MRIVFIGTGEIGVPTLRALQKSEHELVGVVTQPDKPVGRAQKITAPPIKKALTGETPNARPVEDSPRRARTLQPARIKDREVIDQISALAPDIIVVMAYGQILSRAVLEIPRIACLNLHASLLPRWRGAAPIQAAIAAGDRETGMTVMYMDEGLDTGDILLQRKIDISLSETGATLHDRLAQIAPKALLESLRLLAAGNAPRIPQGQTLATYAPKLNREAGRINWNETAKGIERKIRAYNPWPGAFTDFEDRKLKIFSASVVDLPGTPGAILRKDNELVIATADHALSLGEVQLEGTRRMSAAEFLRGHGVPL
ncbi:MAG: methionyl-tRNA formyltransferase [Verrucomicrobiota bacterium]|nr:methionyl-tRNA formyltransferase [Verrucomicrobiota bacterium]